MVESGPHIGLPSRSMSSVRAIDQDEVPFRYGVFRGPAKVGQVDLHIEASVPDDAWLGMLPPLEMFLAGLQLPWDRGLVRHRDPTSFVRSYRRPSVLDTFRSPGEHQPRGP